MIRGLCQISCNKIHGRWQSPISDGFLHVGGAAQRWRNGFVRAGEEAEGSSLTLTTAVGLLLPHNQSVSWCLIGNEDEVRRAKVRGRGLSLEAAQSRVEGFEKLCRTCPNPLSL